MGVDNPDWATAAMQDGWTPDEGDPDDPVTGIFSAVEAGPPRRRKVDDVLQRRRLVPVYEYVAPEIAIVFNPATGKMKYVNGGSLDELSGQRVHRDEQKPLPLGSVSAALDIADVANDSEAIITRRKRMRAGKMFKTIGK